MMAWIQSLIVLAVLFGAANGVEAQVVSIYNQGGDPTSMLVEGALKRHLRAEGYQVKSGTVDGFLIILSAMEAKTVRGERFGVFGSVLVGSVDWSEWADSLVAEGCNKELATEVKRYLGTEFVYIDNTIATAASEEALAEILSTFVNTSVRNGAKKVNTLMKQIEEASQRRQPMR
ncbi:hypothetical protein [Nitrospira sp. Kam-Ns4a]